MEIVDIRGGYAHESKHNVLALNDCLYRTRALPARWALFMDFDEFLFVRPPHSLASLLRQNKDAPFLTFGSLWWSINYCRQEGGGGLTRGTGVVCRYSSTQWPNRHIW